MNSFKEVQENLPPWVKKVTSNDDVEMVAISLGTLREALKENPSPEIYKQIQALNESLMTYDKFVNYAYKCMLDSCPTYAAAYADAKEEIMSYVWEEIFSHIQSYRVSLGDITTFCKPHIKHGCALYISNLNKKSRYYNEVYTKISQVEKEYMAEGYDESEITDDMILDKLPELTGKRIAEARKRNDLSRQSTLDTSYEAPSFDTPEKELMKKEENNILYEILSNLQEYQKTLLIESTSSSRKWLEELGKNDSFIKQVKDAGFIQFVTVSGGQENIKPLKMQILYKQALNEAKYYSGRKPEAKAGKGSFISFSDPMESEKEIDSLLLEL